MQSESDKSRIERKLKERLSSSSLHLPKPHSPPSTSHTLPKSQSYNLSTCPICSEVFSTLAQLNNHLDDHHQEDPIDMVMGWFRKTKQVTTNIIQKAAANNTADLEKVISNTLKQPFILNDNAEFTADADAIIDKSHWQKTEAAVTCTEIDCGKSLGIRFGKENCYRCGNLYCQIHSSFQIRLNPHAIHDPIHGLWYRCCFSCFVSREGYFDNFGVTTTKTHTFITKRKEFVDKVLLEANLLEKRFEKVADIVRENNKAGKRKTLISWASSLTLSEQIVPWEDDTSAPSCPECNSSFYSILNRRHHCRLCGRVICRQESCSSNIPVYEKDNGDFSVKVGQVRSCTRCFNLVNRRIDQSDHVPIVVEYYHTMCKLRLVIQDKYSLFNNLLFTLRSRTNIPIDDHDYHLASRLRKQLLDLLHDLDNLGKKVKSLQCNSHSEAKLYNNIYISTNTFLQTHMFTLQLMPRLNNTAKSEPKVVKLDVLTREDNIRILEEQCVQIKKFIRDASSKRRFEDVKSLTANLNELEGEIDELKKH